MGGAANIEDIKLSSQTQQLLFLHAGLEFSVDPDPELIEFEKNLPDSVLAFVGHHTHRPSGIEYTPKRIIAWSLGNVCTPFGGDPVRWGTEWSYVNCRVSGEGAVVELAQNYPFHE